MKLHKSSTNYYFFCQQHFRSYCLVISKTQSSFSFSAFYLGVDCFLCYEVVPCMCITWAILPSLPVSISLCRVQSLYAHWRDPNPHTVLVSILSYCIMADLVIDFSFFSYPSPPPPPFFFGLEHSTQILLIASKANLTQKEFVTVTPPARNCITLPWLSKFCFDLNAFLLSSLKPKSTLLAPESHPKALPSLIVW